MNVDGITTARNDIVEAPSFYDITYLQGILPVDSPGLAYANLCAYLRDGRPFKSGQVFRHKFRYHHDLLASLTFRFRQILDFGAIQTLYARCIDQYFIVIGSG